MIKKIKKEDYEKVVELIKERNPEYIVEKEFFDLPSLTPGLEANTENKSIMLELRLKKEDFPETNIELERIRIEKELYSILEGMSFENCIIEFKSITKGIICKIYQREQN